MKKNIARIIIPALAFAVAFAPLPFAASPLISFGAAAESASGGKLAAAAKKPAAKKKSPPPLAAKDLVGRLVLQKDSGNKLWYIEPASKMRYYLRGDEDVAWLISALGRKVTAAEFAKLAKTNKTKAPAALLKKFGGSIIISPHASTTAYYVNPADGVSYVISSQRDLHAAAKVIGLSAPDSLLRQIAMNARQATYDPAYNGTAYVRFDGEKYYDGSDSDRLLPLASLTKVMTALVFIETNPDWNKVIEITPEEIRYPCTLQLCGTTSEINLKAGDKLRVIDLWVAMLSASSNQASVILADNSGLTRAGFVARMNAKAAELGLAKTRFVEMSGLSADNVSTAKEFAKVAHVAFDNSWIAQGTRSEDYVFTVEQADGSPRDVRVQNRNYSLLAMGPNASKSGYLVEAQRNAVVEKDGEIAIALHCYSLGQRNAIISRLINGSHVASAE